MRRLLPALLIATVAATPASAQIWDGGGHGEARMPQLPAGVGRERADIDRTIRQAREDGQITRRDARALRRENDQIGTLQDRYAADGLSASEGAELQSRAEALRGLVNADRLRGDK